MVSMCEKEERAIQWWPCVYVNFTQSDIQKIIDVARSVNWSKMLFHKYFKNIEKNLLIELRDAINKNLLHQEFIKYMSDRWRLVALLRDFHDYIYGRDNKHYIRTDDCRRFIDCIEHGMRVGVFTKPIHRILCKKDTPGGFTHPLFKQFN